MAMQEFARLLRSTGNPEDSRHADTVESWLKERKEDISSPFGATPIKKQTLKTPEAQLGLRQRTYELLSTVREPSAEERESLARKGFIFLSIEAKTLAQVVSEHPGHFWKDELQYVNGLPHPDLRTYTPKAMEVAFNPNQLYVPDSFNKTQAVQLNMTEEYSQTNLEKELPGAKALMLPATVGAQADIAYFKKTGKVLFRDRFARALDQTAGSNAANVGRGHPDFRLIVDGWGADSGLGRGGVGAPLAVVFIRK